MVTAFFIGLILGMVVGVVGSLAYFGSLINKAKAMGYRSLNIPLQGGNPSLL